MRNFYNGNSDFRDYVEKYRRDHKLSVDEALERALVRGVAEHYKEKENEENGIIESELPKSGAD